MTTEVALTTDFAIILVAAAVVGFLAHQTDQPTIVAYIVTGLILGPAALGIVSPSELTEAMGELGLAFLLFLLGIKMRIEDIRDILLPIVKISIPQMILVCLVGMGISFLLGFSMVESLLIGLAVMYSSTAVVVKMLTDKDEVTSLPGKIDVGILLVQDIVVVILLTLLAGGQPESAMDVGVSLAIILALTVVIVLVAIVASEYALPVVFRRIAENKDVFFIVALAWAFLLVFLAEELGLSIEMGAFLAGIALAQLPYSTVLQDRVSPLTDIFILVFFVSIGLQLEAADLLEYWQEAIIAAIVIMPAKFVIFFLLIEWQDFSLETTFLGSVNMVQVSEFGLIVGTVAVAGGFIDEPVLGFLSLIALITMGISVYLIKFNHTLFGMTSGYLDRWAGDATRADSVRTYRNHAVVIGYDDVTRRALPVLREHYEDIVVIDRQTRHIEFLKNSGYDAIFGDFQHAEVRKASGLKRADFVLSSSDQLDVNTALLEEVPQDATVFVEARWAPDARKLYDRGAHYVIMSSQLTAERLAEYLKTYFEERPTFNSLIERDIAMFRGYESFDEVTGRLSGDTDE